MSENQVQSKGKRQHINRKTKPAVQKAHAESAQGTPPTKSNNTKKTCGIIGHRCVEGATAVKAALLEAFTGILLAGYTHFITGPTWREWSGCF